jgi:hypothetical protein
VRSTPGTRRVFSRPSLTNFQIVVRPKPLNSQAFGTVTVIGSRAFSTSGGMSDTIAIGQDKSYGHVVQLDRAGRLLLTGYLTRLHVLHDHSARQVLRTSAASAGVATPAGATAAPATLTAAAPPAHCQPAEPDHRASPFRKNVTFSPGLTDIGREHHAARRRSGPRDHRCRGRPAFQADRAERRNGARRDAPSATTVMAITKCRIWATPVNQFTLRRDVLRQCGRTSLERTKR